MFFGSVMDGFENHTRLHGHGAFDRIDLLDGVHPLQGEHDLAGFGDVTFHQPRQPALCDQRLARRVADGEDAAHLPGRARPQDRLRLDALAAPDAARTGGDVGAGQHPAIPDDVGKCCEKIVHVRFRRRFGR